MIDFISLILLSFGLSLDDFALAFALCLLFQNKNKSEQWNYAGKMAVAFSISTILLPLLGWLIGSMIFSFVEHLASWIVLLIFSGVGIWIIKEATENDENKIDLNKASSFIGLVIIGIASSLDEGATGLAFPFLSIPIFFIIIAVIIVNTIVVFTASFVVQTKKQWNQKYAVIISGLLLIILGVLKWIQITLL
jgi:putative Mn2+ efflux pump MntP